MLRICYLDGYATPGRTDLPDLANWMNRAGFVFAFWELHTFVVETQRKPKCLYSFDRFSYTHNSDDQGILSNNSWVQSIARKTQN